MEFYVGQKIIGKKESHRHYAYTNEFSVMEVINIFNDNDHIKVRVLKRTDGCTDCINSIFCVRSAFFIPFYKTAKFI